MCIAVSFAYLICCCAALLLIGHRAVVQRDLVARLALAGVVVEGDTLYVYIYIISLYIYI